MAESVNRTGKMTDDGNSTNSNKPVIETDQKIRKNIEEKVLTVRPKITFDDVDGLEEVKQTLKEYIVLPFKFPQLFKGRSGHRCILLFGPPGVGKSELIKALASTSELEEVNFINVAASDLLTFASNTEDEQQNGRYIKNLFEVAVEKKPCVILLDNIDEIYSHNSYSPATRISKTELLIQIEGAGKYNHDQTQILLLGTSTKPDDIDLAVIKRFSKRIFVPLPDAEARSKMFKNQIGNNPCDLTEEDYQELGDKTQGLSGRDIVNVLKAATSHTKTELLQMIREHTPEATEEIINNNLRFKEERT